MDLRNQLQRATEAYDLLEQMLPLHLKGQFTKIRKDPSPFPDKPPGRERYAKLRVMPKKRDVPESFWDTTWCFYVIGVGRLDDTYTFPFPVSGDTDGHVMFQMPHGVGKCGKGKHEAAVDRILSNAKQALGADWGRYEDTKKDGRKVFLIKPYRPGNYPPEDGMPPARALAQDLAALISATYPEFLRYGGGA